MQTGMISSSSAVATATQTKTPSNSLDKDSFLKLFVAQLKNQDPTSASSNDPNQMVQQLTSYAGLEQAQQTNTLLTGLQTQTSGLFQAQTASLVGKTVKVDGSGFNLSGGKASMNLELAAPADVTVIIKDAKGTTVATVPKGQLSRGVNLLDWNGRDMNGNLLPDGSYKVEVMTADADGRPVAIKTNLTMKVDAVTFKDGGIYLASGSTVFSLKDVLEILS